MVNPEPPSQREKSYSVSCKLCDFRNYRVFYKEKLRMYIKSSNTVLKNQILVADGIELPAFGKKG